jgi:hypothetical protein
METPEKLTAKNSVVMAYRVHNRDKKRIEAAAKKTNQAPGVFSRVGVLNEVEFVENQ